MRYLVSRVVNSVIGGRKNSSLFRFFFTSWSSISRCRRHRPSSPVRVSTQLFPARVRLNIGEGRGLSLRVAPECVTLIRLAVMQGEKNRLSENVS